MMILWSTLPAIKTPRLRSCKTNTLQIHSSLFCSMQCLYQTNTMSVFKKSHLTPNFHLKARKVIVNLENIDLSTVLLHLFKHLWRLKCTLTGTMGLYKVGRLDMWVACSITVCPDGVRPCWVKACCCKLTISLQPKAVHIVITVETTYLESNILPPLF